MEDKETKYECFSCYCGCNPCPECQEKELIQLRAWKAKARPYIEERLEFLQNCLEEASGPIDEGFEVELKELEELSELTELLGGSDE